jgi:hypothetical protein
MPRSLLGPPHNRRRTLGNDVHNILPDYQIVLRSGVTAVCGNLPGPGGLVMPEHVHASIIGMDPEPALLWRVPAVGYCMDRKPALAQPERQRLLCAAIAAVGLHAYAHARPRRTLPVSWGLFVEGR